MSNSREDEIFNAVDNGTYKFALQQCQKLIKKSPNSTYYRVLENFVLLESGKSEEALANCLEILDKTPNDVKSLILLNKIFNKCNRPKEAKSVYENAAKKYPSFELLTSWFHLGCETGDFRTLQKSSIALKNFQSNRRLFKFWAGFNSYLGAINPDATAMEKTLFTKLGLKVIEDTKPMTNEQEVYVLVKLLHLNGHLEKIPDAIWEFTKKNKLDLELQIILLDTLNELEHWEKLYEACRLVLIDYKLDDFNTWKYLIKSSLKLEKNNDVLKVIESYNNTRNSLLASVEYHYQAGLPLEEPVFKYLSKLGTKSCVFPDIKNYISLIDSSKLLSWLEEQLTPEGDQGLSWTVNVTKFKAYFQKDTIFTDTNFIQENIANYNKYKPLLSKKVKTDFFAGEEFLFFVVNSLLTQEFSTKNIVLCIVILENAVLRDVHEFHLRLWLIQLYTLINCHSQARVHYDTLKIKEVQHDIFDQYLISRIGSLSPNHDGFLRDLIAKYEKIEGESVYYTKVCYNKAVFNKLQGMIEFQKRISKSSLKEHVVLQGLKIGRLSNDKSVSAYYENAFQELNLVEEQYDNRDLKIFWDIGIFEESSFKKKIFATIPSDLIEYNKIQRFFESLINGSTDTEYSFDLSCLSDIERWSFEIIVEFVRYLKNNNVGTDKMIELYKSIPEIFDELSWEVSHNAITIIDTTKAIQLLISNAFKFGKNLQRSKLNELKELNIEILQNVRDQVMYSKTQEAHSKLDSLSSELKSDKVLKDLEIDASVVGRVFEIIRSSNDEALKLLRVL